MTEDYQKDLISPLKSHLNMHLAVPIHDVLDILLNKSDQCFHSIG